MIWSDTDILDNLDTGSIRIEPFDLNALQPASVDLRLGNVFWKFKEREIGFRAIDPRKDVKSLMTRWEAEQVMLPPQGFILGSTVEKISLGNNVVGRIEGKSSLARIGLSVHSTGGFIDPGNQDLNITLEIANHSPLPIVLYANMWIAQIAFQNTLSVCDNPYGPHRGSRYYADSEPVPSKVSEKPE